MFAVQRNGSTYVLFLTRGMAEGWIEQEPYRAKDTIKEMVVRFGPGFRQLFEDRRAANLCQKCGEPAQEYTPGNFSVQCKACNKAQGVKRKLASAARRSSA